MKSTGVGITRSLWIRIENLRLVGPRTPSKAVERVKWAATGHAHICSSSQSIRSSTAQSSNFRAKNAFDARREGMCSSPRSSGLVPPRVLHNV